VQLSANTLGGSYSDATDRSTGLSRLTAPGLIAESWSFLKGHLSSLVRAAAFPLALSLFIRVVSLATLSADSSEEIVDSARSLLAVLPWTFFGVTWHRLILSGEPASVSVEWSSRHTRFALFLLVWRAPYHIVSVPEQGSDFADLLLSFFIIAMIVLSYVQARFALFLPAAAIAQPISPRDAWSRSKGYGGAIFWAGVLSVLFGLVLSIPLVAATVFLPQHSPVASELTLVTVKCVVQLVTEALAVGALSFAYRAIHAREGAV
jgi:hypothetical protein